MVVSLVVLFHLFLLLHLLPWNHCDRLGGRLRVRIPRRTEDLNFGQGYLQSTNPLVAALSCCPSAHGLISSMMTSSLLRAPCCQLLLYLMSAFKVIFSCSGMSDKVTSDRAVHHPWQSVVLTHHDHIERRLEVAAGVLDKGEHMLPQLLNLLKCCGIRLGVIEQRTSLLTDTRHVLPHRT